MSVLPAVCTDLKVEGTMKDRKGKKMKNDGKFGYFSMLTGMADPVHMMEVLGCPTQTASLQ